MPHRSCGRTLDTLNAPPVKLLWLFLLAAVLSPCTFPQTAAAQDEELCRTFRQKAIEVNNAYALNKPEGFSSVEAQASCTQKKYDLNVVLTTDAAEAIDQTADQIKSYYVAATCADEVGWSSAFDQGWVTSFYFFNGRNEVVLSMSLNTCN